MGSRRILVWCWSHGGGGSQFAANLAFRLGVEFGPDRVALSLAEGDPTAEAATARGVDVRLARIVSDRRKAIASILGAAHGRKVILEQARDCSVAIGAINFGMLAPLSPFLGKPLIYCAHDPQPHAGDYAVLGQRLTQAWLLRQASHVVAHSRFAAEILAAHSNVRAKLHLAPLSSVFEPHSLGAPKSGPVHFLFAGRMIAYKGLGVLAEALDHLPQNTLWRVTVAGTGPDLRPDMSRKLARPNVEIINEILSEADLAALYKRCDVVLAPYLEASQSGVIAEALALNKPCIVTPVGALSEQIADGYAGWVLNGVSASELAAQMCNLIEHRSEIEAKARGAADLSMQAWRADSWAWLGQFLD